MDATVAVERQEAPVAEARRSGASHSAVGANASWLAGQLILAIYQVRLIAVTVLQICHRWPNRVGYRPLMKSQVAETTEACSCPANTASVSPAMAKGG